MVVMVNGERIDESAIQREMERMRPHYEQAFSDKAPRDRQTELRDWSRENVVERVLLKQYAKKHGKQVPKEAVEEAFERLVRDCGGREHLKEQNATDDEDRIKTDIKSQLEVERLLEELCQDLPKPSKQDVAEFYEQNKEAFQRPERVRVAHIVKHIDGPTDQTKAYEKMTKAENELREGTLFEALVAKYSDCPDNGGDLGYIVRGQMVEEFEDVVFNLGVGEVSEIFRTRFGYHIAKVYERKPATIAPLKEVMDQAQGQLEQRRRSEAIDKFIDHLRSEAEIKVVE